MAPGISPTWFAHDRCAKILGTLKKARAICAVCEGSVPGTRSCVPHGVEVQGLLLGDIPFGSESRGGVELAWARRHGIALPRHGECSGCGVAEGGHHHPGCDEEECPGCHGRAFACGCAETGPPTLLARLGSAVLYAFAAASLSFQPTAEQWQTLSAILAYGHRRSRAFEPKEDPRLALSNSPVAPLLRTDQGTTPGTCYRCNREGFVASCRECARTFHAPRCDGYAVRDELLCWNCYTGGRPFEPVIGLAEGLRWVIIAWSQSVGGN